jgi:hypothetical protein
MRESTADVQLGDALQKDGTNKPLDSRLVPYCLILLTGARND